MDKVKLANVKTNSLGQKSQTIQNKDGQDIVCPVTPPFLMPNDFGKIDLLRLPCNSNCICFDLMEDGKYFGCRHLKIKYEIS